MELSIAAGFAVALMPTSDNSAVAVVGMVTRSKFAWSKVSDRVVMGLLLAAPERLPEGINLKNESLDRRRRCAARVYGTPPQFKKLDEHEAWDVLRDEWAGKEAKKTELAALSLFVLRGLPIEERQQVQSSVVALRAFLRQRNLVLNFKKNLLKAFRRAHKVQQIVGKPPTEEHFRDGIPPLNGPILLTGEGAKRSNTAFKHQREAHTELDRLAKATSPEKPIRLMLLVDGAIES